MSSEYSPITDSAVAVTIAQAARRDGSFAFDLEFVSEDRYIPELALVQVGWGDVESPQVAAIDPLAADARPLAELVASPEVATIVHSGQGDLTLLAREFGVRGRSIFDTQIAVGFLGIADQIGYGKLVEEMLGIAIDKAMQFTRWLQRPLSQEQVRYALDDVRYLPRIAEMLREELLQKGRLAWVVDESDRLAESSAQLSSPEEAYRKIGAWRRLSAQQLGVLQALATWRERKALARNKPPSWILKNGVLLSLAKRLPIKPGDLDGIDGLHASTRRRRGKEILAVVARGAAEPAVVDGGPPPHRLTNADKKLSAEVSSLIQQRCRENDLAPRFVANRSDCDALVRWWVEGHRSQEPGLPLLSGWRREFAGAEVLDFLSR